MATLQSDVLVIGGGLAGIVTALECLRGGRDVILVDRDTPERFGGLALWAFGGMALVGTPLQARKRIIDTPEIALRACMAKAIACRVTTSYGAARPPWCSV